MSSIFEATENNIYCPYCNQGQDIDHDDGAGYEEDKKDEQECISCSKIFVFSTAVSYDYEAYKAPCLNGGEHKWSKQYIFPRHWPDAKICNDCEYEVRGKYVEDIN